MISCHEKGHVNQKRYCELSNQKTNWQIKKRLILNFPGFEQTDSARQLDRLQFGAEHTGKIWGFEVERGSLNPSGNAHHTEVSFKSAGKNWKVKANLVQYRWNDIVHAYEKEPFPIGFLKNARKFAAFFIDGTVRRYRKASWRYWGFTIFPVLLAMIFAIVSWLALYFLGAPLWVQIIAVPLATLLLCKWPGDKLYIPLTVADWGFARDMVLQTNPKIEARFAEFGETTLSQIKNSDADEIIIVGHSFGSLWAVAALSLALQADPDLLKNKKVRVMALGSSLLKIGLAPGAQFIRDHWKRVMAQKEVFWHEVQTKDDLIAFYKCNPLEQIGITDPLAGFAITRIRFSKGMAKKRYRSMRKSFYRTHRQYILHYDKRVHFDYMLRLFGPFCAKFLALDENAHTVLDETGTLH